jgi:N-acetylmuramoyl-L-alanine amidase
MKTTNIKNIVIHCSATREGDDTIDAEVIDRWHKARGWKGNGYHFVVLIDGTIQTGRKINECGAHTRGLNCQSWGVCYIGGVEKDGKTPKDTRTDKQKETLEYLLYFLKLLAPQASINGHRDFANKACPSFDATEEYKNL